VLNHFVCAQVKNGGSFEAPQVQILGITEEILEIISNFVDFGDLVRFLGFLS
jgi:hypothetical protein